MLIFMVYYLRQLFKKLSFDIYLILQHDINDVFHKKFMENYFYLYKF